MNLEKVVFGFFVLLAATLNMGFFVGDISKPELHNIYELFAALAVSLIATVLKFGDRTQIGAVHLATSLVADLQLVAAAVTWVVAEQVSAAGVTAESTASVVSLSGGALLANLVSVVLLVTEDGHLPPGLRQEPTVSNPLMVFLELLGRRDPVRRLPDLPALEPVQASSAIFVVMRRMRVPLVTLIVIFFVSVVGLSLIPGVDLQGRPARLSLFDAFYFVSYTATTIGFGELPWPFTAAQRLWVTLTIYASVIGWAYAIGSLLTLLQDRAFRHAVALQGFVRKVSRIREPFFLVVGFGRAGELLARDFDALGQQLVVVDSASHRIDALELGSYHADIPGLVADASNPRILAAAGLGHPSCAAVLAMSNDDETNLAVTMAAALLRPDLPVVARTVSAPVAERMRAFGTPTVVNPFDRFGEHLRLALNAPCAFQLLTWLEAGPGGVLPGRGRPRTDGPWVVCGYGRFGREVTADLRDAGLEVVVVESVARADHEAGVVVGDAADADVLRRAGLEHAVGLVAGTDNDTTNLSMLATARRMNPHLFLAARQNLPTSAALFEAMHPDALLVPTEVVAHEVYAQLSTPLLWRFIQRLPGQDDAWAAEVIARLRTSCGHELPALWKVALDGDQAPGLRRYLPAGRVRLGDLLRSPDDRERALQVVPLLLLRGQEAILTPGDDQLLEPGDQLLFAGHGAERRGLGSTLVVDSTATYVLTGRRVASGWLWKRLSGEHRRSQADDEADVLAGRRP